MTRDEPLRQGPRSAVSADHHPLVGSHPTARSRSAFRPVPVQKAGPPQA